MSAAYRSTLAKLARFLPDQVTPDQLAKGISNSEAAYLESNWQSLSDVEKVWQAMDEEWDRTNAGYRAEDSENLGIFYSSPVWLLNGIFTATDPESIQHRTVLADFVAGLNPATITEFGGGFGSLSRNLASRCPRAAIKVVEPFASKLALALSEDIPNLEYCDTLPEASDVVIAQDVLEHITDPLGQFSDLLNALPVGGIVITANCFKPVIKCHYPGAYHFNHTFRYIAPHLGCRLERRLPGAKHIEIYRKVSDRVGSLPARVLEGVSKLAGPAMKVMADFKRR